MPWRLRGQALRWRGGWSLCSVRGLGQPLACDMRGSPWLDAPYSPHRRTLATHVRTNTHIYTNIYIIYTHTYIHIYIHAYAHIYTFTAVYIFITQETYVHIYIYIYINACTHTSTSTCKRSHQRHAARD